MERLILDNVITNIMVAPGERCMMSHSLQYGRRALMMTRIVLLKKVNPGTGFFQSFFLCHQDRDIYERPQFPQRLVIS